jgi:hypothetical protein
LVILGVNERIIGGIQGLVLLLLVFLTYVKNKDGIHECIRKLRKEMKKTGNTTTINSKAAP